MQPARWEDTLPRCLESISKLSLNVRKLDGRLAECPFSKQRANKEGKIISLDARPSDAIALAVRSHVPVFVSEVVMMQAKLVNSEKDAEETKKFAFAYGERDIINCGMPVVFFCKMRNFKCVHN